MKIIKSIKTENFSPRIIRVAYSRQYLEKNYANLSNYHELLLNFVVKFRELPKKESRVKQKKFFDKLSRLDRVNKDVLNVLFEQVYDLEFKSNERKFHPLVIENLQRLDHREWLQNLLDDGEPEEDIPKILSHIRELESLNDPKALSEFNGDSELFNYLQQFKVYSEVEYPDKLKSLLNDWKVDEMTVEGHKVELYHLKRVEIDHRDSLQIIGESSNWCVCHYPNPVTSYKPDEYYCFFINGDPEVLLHKESEQIKNTDNESLSNHLVKYVNPLVQKHMLVSDSSDYYEENYDEFDDIYDESDFEDYNAALHRVEEVEASLSNPEEAKALIRRKLTNINFFPIDKIWDYIPWLYGILINGVYSSSYSYLSKDVLSVLGSYINLSGKEIPISLREYVLDALQNNANGYLKRFPKSLRKLFSDYNSGFEVLRDHNVQSESGVGEKLSNSGFFKTKLALDLMNLSPHFWWPRLTDKEKSDPVILDLFADYYVSTLKKSADSWDLIPEEVKSISKVKNFKPEVAQLYHDRFYDQYYGTLFQKWSSIPDDIKDEELILKCKKNFIEFLKASPPENFLDFPKDLINDPELREPLEVTIDHTAKKIRRCKSVNNSVTFIKKIEKHNNVFYHPKIQDAIEENLSLLIKINPSRLEEVPEKYRTDEMIIAYKEGIIETLKRSPSSYSEDCKKYPELLEAKRQSFIEILKSRPRLWDKVPEEWKNESEFINARIDGIVAMVNDNWRTFHSIDESYKSDPRIVAAKENAVRHAYLDLTRNAHDLVFHHMPEEIFNHPDITELAYKNIEQSIMKNIKNYSEVPKYLQNDQRILDCLFESKVEKLKEDPYSIINLGNKHLKDPRVLESCTEGLVKHYIDDPLHIAPYKISLPPYLQAKIHEAKVLGFINLLRRDVNHWSRIPQEFRDEPRVFQFKEERILYYIDGLKREPEMFNLFCEELQNDPRIAPFRERLSKKSSSEMIKTAYSKQYLEKNYPNSSMYYNLILSYIERFKELPKKEIKVKQKKFFDQLSKLEKVNESNLDNLFNQVYNLSFKSQEDRSFHPLVVENLQRLDHREWLQGLLDNGEPEEDIPKILSHIRELGSYDPSTNISDFKSDSELFEHLKRFKKENTAEYPDSLKSLLSDWKVDEMEVEGHKVELYYLKRAKDLEGEYILFNGLDSIQYIGQNNNWCVDNEPKVLAHESSDQIKDENDNVLNNYLIKLVDPLIRRYDLNTGREDFDEYDETFEKIVTLSKRGDDKAFVNDMLDNDINLIDLLPLDESWRYMPKLYDSIIKEGNDKFKNRFYMEDCSKGVLENLGNYISVNKLERPKMMKEFLLDTLTYEVERYLKVTPKSFRKLFPEYNKFYDVLLREQKEGPQVLIDSGILEDENIKDFINTNTVLWEESLDKINLWDNLGGNLFEHFVSAYEERLSNDKEHWGVIPSEIKSDPRIQKFKESVIDHFIDILADQPIYIWSTIPSDLKSDSRIQAIKPLVISDCEKLLKKDPAFWRKIPSDLKDEEEIKNLKELSIDHFSDMLTQRNMIYESVPEDLQKEKKILNAYKHERMDHLMRSPFNWAMLPGEFRATEDFKDVRVKSLCKFLFDNPEKWNKIEDEKFELKEHYNALYESAVSGCEERLKNKEYGVWIYIPDEIRSNPRISNFKNEVLISFARHYRETDNPGYRLWDLDRELTEDLLCEPTIQMARLFAARRTVYLRPERIELLPNDLLKKPRVKEALVEGIKNRLSSDPDYSYSESYLSDNDKAELFRARIDSSIRKLRHDHKYYESISEELKSHHYYSDQILDYFVGLLKDNLFNYSIMPEEFKDHPRIMYFFPQIVQKYIELLKDYEFTFDESALTNIPDEVLSDPKMQEFVKFKMQESSQVESSKKFKLIKI
jgi:hypothetical protein